MALVQTPPRPPWEAGRHVDGGAIGQRHHRADTRHRHQAPAYLIVPDDGQQATMKHADLLAKRPPDNEQRFDQNSQIRQVLDKLLDARLEPYHFHHAHLEAEVTQVLAGRYRWRWPWTAAVCDASAASAVSCAAN